MTRKQFLDLGRGAFGAVGLAAIGGCFDPNSADDMSTDGTDTGSTGGGDDGLTLTDPSPTTDDDTSGVTVDPNDSSSSADPDTGADDTSGGDGATTGGDSTGGDGTDDDSTDGDSTSGGSTSGESTSSTDEVGSTGEQDCNVDPNVVIANNHMHTMVVTLEEVQAAEEVVYDIMGGAGHSHSVTLTEAHFEMLAQGLDVMVVSTQGSMHTHMITVSCG